MTRRGRLDKKTCRRKQERERWGLGFRIGRWLTDGDIALSTQRGAQDPVLPYGHDLARRILREIDLNVPLQLRSMWAILPTTIRHASSVKKQRKIYAQ